MKVIKRIRGQKLPENTVYVGRPSKWGNPFKIDTDMSAKEAVQAFIDYMEHLIEGDELDPKQLKGKNLACWCGNWEIGEPEIDCHAVVLLKIANGNPELMPNGEIWTDDTVIGLTEKGREQFLSKQIEKLLSLDIDGRVQEIERYLHVCVGVDGFNYEGQFDDQPFGINRRIKENEKLPSGLSHKPSGHGKTE